MSADDNAPEQAREVEVEARALDVWACTHCATCGKPIASEQDWDETEPGERTDLCFDEHTCGFYDDANMAATRAQAVLAALAPVRAAERQEAARAAWDDGYFHGWDDESFEERGKTPNPYRADGVTGRSGTP